MSSLGAFLADSNNEEPEIRINLSGNYLGTLGVHLAEFWTLTTASGDTVRDIAKTRNLILRNVLATLDVANGTIFTVCTFESEAPGYDGIATDCPTFPDLGGDDFTIPEPEDLNGALVTARFGSTIYLLKQKHGRYVPVRQQSICTPIHSGRPDKTLLPVKTLSYCVVALAS